MQFEDLISASGWELTKQNLSEFHNLFEKLWNHQTLAVLDASKHTDRFADFPVNQVIAEGLEPLRQTRGDLGREPMNELVIEKSIYGYDMLYVDGKFKDMNHSRVRRKQGENPVLRKNVALLDPNISVEGISRGTILTDTRSRFFKSKSVAVLGFFPNGDVLVQELTRPGVRPKISSISLSRATRMRSVGTSNINRMSLYGDLVYQPTESEINNGLIKLSNQTQNLRGLQQRKEQVENHNKPDIRLCCLLAEAIGCTIGGLFSAIGLLADFGDVFTMGMQILLPSASALWLTYSLPLVYERSAGVDDGNHMQHPTALAKLPVSDTDSLFVRSETLWIGSNSLTEDERLALGIVDGKEWLVSTSGQKLLINP